MRRIKETKETLKERMEGLRGKGYTSMWFTEGERELLIEVLKKVEVNDYIKNQGF